MNLTELIRNHNLCLIAFLKTKMINHAPFKDDFAFDEMFEVSVVGYSKGMVLMWHSNMVHVNRTHRTDKEIHVMIQVLPSAIPWFLSVIYVSTDIAKRLVYCKI